MIKMKKETLDRYFEEIKELTEGNNTSNSDIIDYADGSSIDREEIEEEYYKYCELVDEIDEYIDDNDLDDIKDRDEIIKHFSNILDEDYFEFSQAILKDFARYMSGLINKKVKNA